MKKLFVILSLTFLLAGELEVDGDLTVSGAIQSPTIDALSGMKPERIYAFQKDTDENFTFTVPEGKMWAVQVSPNWYLRINGADYLFSKPAILLPGWTLESIYSDPIYLHIYEYPISGSGTEQGMDYIIP